MTKECFTCKWYEMLGPDFYNMEHTQCNNEDSPFNDDFCYREPDENGVCDMWEERDGKQPQQTGTGDDHQF